MKPIEKAVSFLRETLSDGPLPAEYVRQVGAQHGIARRTLFRAKVRLGIEARQLGFHAGWVWQFPQEERTPQSANSRNFGISLREQKRTAVFFRRLEKETKAFIRAFEHRGAIKIVHKK